MTDGNVDDATYLVRVRAQVMARDDSSGGWVPMGGGGLSNVCVRKRSISCDDVNRGEYMIYGKRITDQMVVLCCTINKDFQYNKVMPTFHHWKTGDKKFGLTFQTAADARAFDKVVRSAIDDITNGTGDYSHNHYTDAGDDEVFMTVELPVISRSSSVSSNGNGVAGCHSLTTPNIPSDTLPSTLSPNSHHHSSYNLHCMHFISPTRTSNGSGSSGIVSSANETEIQQSIEVSRNFEELQSKDKSPSYKDLGKEFTNEDNDKIEVMSGEPYSYVQFAVEKTQAEHEYSYPVMDSIKLARPESFDNIRKHQVISTQPPLLPKKKDRKRNNLHSPLTRAQCRYCLEMFNEEENQKGSCEYAPDEVLACISASTCISCAQCMLYHCLSDAEGDFNHHLCSCNSSDQHCHRHWIGLTLLSIFVPCLWCYLPLRACHSCCSNYGMCGGKHEAI